MTYEEIVNAWNAQADEHNQYDALSDRERIEFALRMAGQVEKQEPYAWSRLDTAKSVITENEDIKRGWDLDGLPFIPLFAAPQPCPECAHYVQEIIEHQATITILQNKKFARFHDDECWIYQGDDEDHLESLVCPVVISVAQLAERDARTLMVAAEIADQWAEGRQPENGGYALRNFATCIRTKADELAKAQNG